MSGGITPSTGDDSTGDDSTGQTTSEGTDSGSGSVGAPTSTDTHLRARAPSSGRQRAVCGARAPAEQLAAALTAISSPAHAAEIAEQLLAASSGVAEAWRVLASWIETGVLVGGPPHLRNLLAAVRVELDRRGLTPETTAP
ncbi:MAG TPA: hypothetical protein VIK91_24045 [Nannocystis sp.]